MAECNIIMLKSTIRYYWTNILVKIK